jgi:RNA polymerase sigma-70 factor (ECF subfamily)
LKEWEYEQKITEEQQFLYRIAYVYLGDEAAALETVRKTVAECYDMDIPLDDDRKFRLETARTLMKEGGVNRQPNRYLTALYLRHLEAMDTEDIAYTMDIPEGTVHSYLHRAREEMRQDTAGIGHEVRLLCSLEASEELDRTVKECIKEIQARNRIRNRKRLAKICLGGLLAAALGILLVGGMLFGNEETGETEEGTAVYETTGY